MEARIESLLAPLATDTSHPTPYSSQSSDRRTDFRLSNDELEDLKRRAQLPRSASSPQVSSEFSKGKGKEDNMSGAFTFSEEDLLPAKSSWPSRPPDEIYEPTELGHDLSPSSSTLYSKSPEIPPDSKITVSRALLISEQQAQERSSEETTDAANQVSSGRQSPQRSRALSRTLTSLSNRKSRLSQNSSPEKLTSTYSNRHPVSHISGETVNGSAAPQKSSVKRRSWRSSKSDATTTPSEEKPADGTISRTRSILNRRSKGSTKPFGSLLQFSGSDRAVGSQSPPRAASPKQRPATPLTQSFSNSNLPSLGSEDLQNQRIPPLPGTIQTEHLRHTTSYIPKKRDELWNAFRALDGDFQKFQSKSTALKANLVRISLLPFLRTYLNHPSNNRLRPEDLDRRTIILNKWWSSMLEMLNGRNNQSISGTDRPAILEGISGIMERPEWRHSPSAFCAIAERSSVAEVVRSSAALHSGSTEFLLESVHHNVRNLFSQNLFTQIAYAVEKMSQRHAPASLVSFCGKTCAYAFFFCPGIADILVRLWDLKASDIGRVLNASGVGKSARLDRMCEVIVPNFPPRLDSLKFVSLKSTMQSLKAQLILPLGVDKVQWYGHWLGRWSGRDSELFYVFVKHFSVLLLDFLPPNATREERACAPGFILVQAQILANLDSTIHRQSNQAAAAAELGTEASISFDDLLGADGSATAMPALPANASRMMTENRLIMLLRDFLTERDGSYSPSCVFFAESFCDVLRASAQSTSIYDHNTCFTLCDFIQEAFVILIKFENSVLLQRPPLDWDFWLMVFKQMVQSQNTTTEIRVYALIFTIWSALTSNGFWKAQLCLDFLLDEDHFIQAFNHWCPMVRAYYMRLLCWRIARYDGDASDDEVIILKTLMYRLHQPWSHHKFLAAKARNHQTLPPSTAPCNPAPSRKLLIIRTDTPATSSVLSSFNSMVPSVSHSQSAAMNRPSSQNVIEGTVSSPTGLLEKVAASLDQGGDSNRRRNSLFRSILGYRSSENRSRSQSPKPGFDSLPRNLSPKRSTPSSNHSSRGTSPDRGSASRSSLYESRPSRPSLPRTKSDSKSSGDRNPQDLKANQPSQAFFKFSLEFVDRRPHTIPSEMALEPPRLPLAAQLLLQSMPDFVPDVGAERPEGFASDLARYSGRALAEWTLVVNECQNFFERRRNEGIPSNRLVETPTLGVESFRRPG